MRFASIFLPALCVVPAYAMLACPAAAQQPTEKTLRDASASFEAAQRERNKAQYDSLERSAIQLGLSDNARSVGMAGDFYLFPKVSGYQPDPRKAMVYYERCANLGRVECAHMMGVVLDSRRYKIQDYPAALAWYRKGADAGFARSYSAIGVMYANGQGVTKSFEQSFENYRRAAELGWRGGLFGMGLQHMIGQHVAQDRDRALALFLVAKDRGDSRAQRRIDSLRRTTDNLGGENTITALKAEIERTYPEGE